MGINENLAREILELHTLGVDGGYSQADVTTFAQAISGWSIGGQDHGRKLAKFVDDHGTPGEFHFRDVFHEPGAKKLLGKSYGDDGVRQGEAMLRDLAMRRETARHISTKLARHFIADDPPKAAVERITRAWLDSRGHLPTVYEALVESPEAWEQPLAKFKTPADYIYSSYRALGIPMREKRRALQPFEALGQRNLMPGSPAGWPDVSADWDGSSALLKRIAWADVVAQRMGDARNARDLAPQLLGGTLTDDTAKAIARAESGAQALTLAHGEPGVHAPLMRAETPMEKPLSRRAFLETSLFAGASTLMASRLAFANAPTDARFVFVLLRGALDGLSAVPPVGRSGLCGAARADRAGEVGRGRGAAARRSVRPASRARVPASRATRRRNSRCCTPSPRRIASARISMRRTCSRAATCARMARPAAG